MHKMSLRPFGVRSGLQVAPASMGAMRFPGPVDQAVQLIRHAIDDGMVYIDTSRGYTDSETKLAVALKDGYREKVILSTKWAPWVTKIEPDDAPTADSVRRRIDEQLKRLDVQYLDFYQVWNIDSREHYQQAVAKGGMVDGIMKAKADGLVRHTGFTTHDSVENLLQYLDEADWCEVILISFNLLNTHYRPVLEKAHQRGIGTILMNPMGGGRLTHPSPVLEELATKAQCRSQADLALRYLMSLEYVDTVLCGMTKLEDVDDTIGSVLAGPLSSQAMQHVEQFLDSVSRQRQNYCTGCRYCLPCPQGIDIPSILSAVFDEKFLGFKQEAAERYRKLSGAKADACAHCGSCQEKCPQKLDIMDQLEYANFAYSG